jgi:hypothetical protein
MLCQDHKRAPAATSVLFVRFTPASQAAERGPPTKSMHPDTRGIAAHMKEFGLHLLGRSLVDVTFSEMGQPYAHAMGVARCAHAVEITIKARIAEEHPLLIFVRVPKPAPKSLLGIERLMTEGRTLTYADLPDALWATTGYQIPDIQQFQEFGRLRNTITHLVVPNFDLCEATLRFAFQVIEPMIYDFWQSDIVEYYESYLEEEEYLAETLQRYGISFSRRR